MCYDVVLFTMMYCMQYCIARYMEFVYKYELSLDDICACQVLNCYLSSLLKLLIIDA